MHLESWSTKILDDWVGKKYSLSKMFSFEYEQKTNYLNWARGNPLLCGGFYGGTGHANVSKNVVCQLGKTFFHAPRLAFCSSLDNALPPHGDCFRSGMALKQIL